MLDKSSSIAGMAQVWSCGGGTQSAAIAALICTGRLEKPDFALMVDTERERSSTWEYVYSVLIPKLQEVGVHLVIVPKSKYATVDIYTDIGEITLPVFTENGKLPTFCSNEWKQRVARRWLRKQGVEQCQQWIGFSCDELRRVKGSGMKWIQSRFPLIEMRMFRDDCVAFVEKLGWPTPPRSSCWMCPNMGDREWIEIKEKHPADFALAVNLERKIRSSDDGFYLHKQRVPLDLVVLERETNPLFDSFCESGQCFV